MSWTTASRTFAQSLNFAGGGARVLDGQTRPSVMDLGLVGRRVRPSASLSWAMSSVSIADGMIS